MSSEPRKLIGKVFKVSEKGDKGSMITSKFEVEFIGLWKTLKSLRFCYKSEVIKYNRI